MTGYLFIPGTFPTLNDYIDAERKHRLMAAKMKENETYRVKLLSTKLPKFTQPCKFVFTWHEKDRRRDPDNIIFAKKFILDGLVAAGVIPNDTQKWVLGFAESIIIDPKNAGVEILITGKE
jgi:hypothetical protein